MGLPVVIEKECFTGNASEYLCIFCTIISISLTYILLNFNFCTIKRALIIFSIITNNLTPFCVIYLASFSIIG